MDYYVAAGEKINEFRKKRNMTRSQLAEGICSVSYLSRIENGSRCPALLVLRQLSNKLGISGEYMMRKIESETSLMTYELINKAKTYLECNRFESIKLLVDDVDIDKIESIIDRQMIMALSCIAEGALSNKPLYFIKRIDEILSMTYIEGTLPTNVEFGLLIEKVHNYILLNDLKKAREILDFLEDKCDDIVFFVSIQPLIHFFMAESIIAYHEKRYLDAEKFLNKAILEAKANCFHCLLIECYHLRSQIFEDQRKYVKARYWYDYSQKLIDLLFNEDNAPYHLNVNRYIDITTF